MWLCDQLTVIIGSESSNISLHSKLVFSHACLVLKYKPISLVQFARNVFSLSRLISGMYKKIIILELLFIFPDSQVKTSDLFGSHYGDLSTTINHVVVNNSLQTMKEFL